MPLQINVHRSWQRERPDTDRICSCKFDLSCRCPGGMQLTQSASQSVLPGEGDCGSESQAMLPHRGAPGPGGCIAASLISPQELANCVSATQATLPKQCKSASIELQCRWQIHSGLGSSARLQWMKSVMVRLGDGCMERRSWRNCHCGMHKLGLV